MDVSQYLEIFIEESKEHLQNLNESLLQLEKEPEKVEIVNEVFRAAHTLKGMSATMGYKRMQKVTHDMENVLSEIRNGKISVNAKLLDVLFQCLDAIESYLNNIIETTDEGEENNQNIIDSLNEILNNKDTQVAQSTNDVKKEEKTVANEEDSLRKHKNLTIKEFEENAIRKAYEQGYNVYGITIYIQESCILKSARAFIIFRTLENLGQIIKSNPEVQDIEDERFDYDFSVYVVSKESEDKIAREINGIAEIKEVFIDKITIESTNTQANLEQESEAVGSNVELPKTSPKTLAKQPTNNKPIVNRSVRVDIEKLDVLMNLVSELIIIKNGLETYENTSGNQNFNEQIEYLERITTNLHESVMKVRMVPIESVFNRFPRMLRDLARNLNKKFELYMSGEDTELDRTVIDEIGDPLVHLLRNAADHGLETPEERIKNGKNEVGSVYLEAYQDGNNVVIEVRDDGNGIDVDKIRKKAIEKNVVSIEVANSMTDKEIVDLLFKPSFSTTNVISDVSGRGVGLDVVKTKIEALGGDIEVRTKLGEGSTFIIRLPLTLAIIQALMVELGNEKYAIPLNSIRTIEDINVKDIKYVQSKEVIHLRGQVIPIVRLDKLLDVESSEKTTDSITVVIVNKGDKQAGFVVDNLIGQQEIVIKSLGKYASNSKMIAGATILGDGEVALILDVNTLV